MTGQCRDFPASIQIICQCRRDFRRKIQHDLIAAFSRHQKALFSKSTSEYIQSDALRNAYARTQDSEISAKSRLAVSFWYVF